MFATPAQGTAAACINCETTTTPLWRKADDGTNLCNACGLFLKLHGRPRPITLKSGVIKSRNRVKVPQVSTLKRKTPYDLPSPTIERSRQQTNQTISPYNPHPRSVLPQTADATDDASMVTAQYFQDVFDPQLANLTKDTTQTGDEDRASVSDLEVANATLRARVNELELVNDLFRSRVSELERKSDALKEDPSEQDIRDKIAALEAQLESMQSKNELA